MSDTYKMYRDVYDQVSDTEEESPKKNERSNFVRIGKW